MSSVENMKEIVEMEEKNLNRKRDLCFNRKRYLRLTRNIWKFKSKVSVLLFELMISQIL